MAGAGVGDEVQISWRGGGWGGAQRPPQQHTRSKGEQLVLACLLACFLVWLRLCKANKRKRKFKSKKEKGEQLRKRKKERKTKDQRTKGLADQWTSGLQGTSGPGPADQRTSGPGDQRTRGPADQRTGHLHDWEFQGISSHNEYVLSIQ